MSVNNPRLQFFAHSPEADVLVRRQSLDGVELSIIGSMLYLSIETCVFTMLYILFIFIIAGTSLVLQPHTRWPMY